MHDIRAIRENPDLYDAAWARRGLPPIAKKIVDLDAKLPGPLYNLTIVDRFYRFDDASAREWFRKYRTLSSDDPDGLAEVLAVKIATGEQSNRTSEGSR